jgi:hypothetical protein
MNINLPVTICINPYTNCRQLVVDFDFPCNNFQYADLMKQFEHFITFITLRYFLSNWKTDWILDRSNSAAFPKYLLKQERWKFWHWSFSNNWQFGANFKHRGSSSGAKGLYLNLKLHVPASYRTLPSPPIMNYTPK